jgi:hypothetical protein
MGTQTQDGQNTSFPNTIYQQVRDWADRQEAFEKENNAPAPLNDIERAFLEDLRGALAPSSSSPVPLVERDYISMLYRQCRLTSFNDLCRDANGHDIEYRQAKPTGNKISFVDRPHPGTSAIGNLQWTCTVELSETSALEPSIKSFPAVGFGLDASGCYPPFAKKNQAKKCMNDISPYLDETRG